MSDIKFENLQLWYDKTDIDDERPFMLTCKDREVTDGERWVVASLTEEEAKKIYEYLGNFFAKDRA